MDGRHAEAPVWDEAARRPALAPAWKASRRIAVAVALAAFPLLFILDGSVRWPVSPVLPGLVLLALAIVVVPFAVMEVQGRLARRRTPEDGLRKAERLASMARLAVVVAAAWFVLWFVFGV